MANGKWLADKLEEILDKQETHTLTLQRLTITVEEHVRRTNLLEQEVKPIKAHVELMNNVAKFISVISAAALGAHTLGLF